MGLTVDTQLNPFTCIQGDKRGMKRSEVKPGEKYQELTVVREIEGVDRRQVLCKCSCGNQVTVRLAHLRSGHSKTCGKCGVEYKGQRKSISAWAEQYGLKESTLRARLKSGLDIGEALKRGKDK